MGFGADRRPPASFGRAPNPEPEPAAPPVMHVGQVHAELVLTPVIDPEALHALGGQIATMVANATRQGFDAGMAAALADMEGAQPDSDPAGVDDSDLADAVGKTRAAGGRP